MIRLSASCVAISLDLDVTVRTQAAYPRLLTRRTSTRLLFYLTPRRDCRVSLPPEAGLVSVALPRASFLRNWHSGSRDAMISHWRRGIILCVHYIRRMGIIHYAVLRSPDFPPSTNFNIALMSIGKLVLGDHLLSCPVYQRPIPSLLYSPVYPHPDSLAGEYVLWKPL